MKDEIQELKNIIHEIEKFAEIINEKSLFIKLLIKELQTKEQLW